MNVRPSLSTRRLRTDVELTNIGMGVSQFGNLYRETSDEVSAAAVERARQAGVRYFRHSPALRPRPLRAEAWRGAPRSPT